MANQARGSNAWDKQNIISFDTWLPFLCVLRPLIFPFFPPVFFVSLFISFPLPSLEQELNNGCMNKSRGKWQY